MGGDEIDDRRNHDLDRLATLGISNVDMLAALLDKLSPLIAANLHSNPISGHVANCVFIMLTQIKSTSDHDTTA